MRIIEVVLYNPDWVAQFESESQLIKGALGDCVHNIHHIGSTSVEGLDAKPIIDIILEVHSLNDLDDKSYLLKDLRYEERGELGIARRRFFGKGGDQRTHQIHAFPVNDEHVIRHLAFRDYLRSHSDIAQEYGELKHQVAQSCNNDIDKYCDGKDAFVKHHEKEALSRLPVELVGYIEIGDEDLEAVKNELPNHIGLTLKEEGCLIFEVTPDGCNRFNVYERFENQIAFEEHQRRVASSHWGAISQNVVRNYQVKHCLPTL